MSKRKLRQELAKLIKELGLPYKLYRGHKHYFYKKFNGSRLRRYLSTMSLMKTGTLVHDCDGFNHVVAGLDDEGAGWRSRFHGYVIDKPTPLFLDGRGCGCPTSPDPPETQSRIEAYMKAYYTREAVINGAWPLSDTETKRRDVLLSGGHVTDDRGILLPEYRDRE